MWPSGGSDITSESLGGSDFRGQHEGLPTCADGVPSSEEGGPAWRAHGLGCQVLCEPHATFCKSVDVRGPVGEGRVSWHEGGPHTPM